MLGLFHNPNAVTLKLSHRFKMFVEHKLRGFDTGIRHLVRMVAVATADVDVGPLNP